MAQLKNPPPRDDFMTAMRKEHEEFDRKHPILDTRYYVQEWQKAYTPWFDPYDDEVPAKLMGTFGPFTKEEYEEFLSTHKPTEGDNIWPREFKTVAEHLRHYSYDKWGR